MCHPACGTCFAGDDMACAAYIFLTQLRTYLVCTEWPCRKLVEQPCFHRWTRQKSFREYVELRLRQALGDDLRRNGVHYAFQQLEILVFVVQELSPVSHAHVYGEVQSATGEGTLGVFVIPAASTNQCRIYIKSSTEYVCI